MDGEGHPRRDCAQIVDRLADLHPRRHGRHGQHVHLHLWHEQRVPGVHQLCPTGIVAQQVGHVVDGGDVGVDHRVGAAGDASREAADGELVARVGCGPRACDVVVVELTGCLRIRVQHRVGIAGDQIGQRRDIHVIGVLVRDQDGVEPGESGEPVREVAGIEKDCGAVVFDQDAGVPEVCDLHGVSMRRRPAVATRERPYARRRSWRSHSRRGGRPFRRAR